MDNNTEQYWSMTEGVFNCLIDTKRSLAFRKAIQKTVRKGDIVVDMGTGSGILAMFAAKAGAKKVYAVEIDKNNIQTLRKTFEKNGLSDTIEVIEGDITKVKIPEKVDVIIGEMIATALIEELQVLAMNNILKSAKNTCKVLLNTYETFADVVYNNETYYGHDFKILRYEYPEIKNLHSTSFTKKESIDFSNFTEMRKNLNVKKNIVFKIKKSGIVNGVRLSGETTFSDGSKLGPTFAYSYPIILPIETLSVTKGNELAFQISYKVCGGLQSLNYFIKK